MKLIVTLLLVLAIGSVIIWRGVESHQTAPPSAANEAIPVTAAQAQQQNVPDFIQSIGTVQSIDSVSIQPRVVGQITQIYFKPGQEVTKGQPLFEIDPRPYQAALDQAQAQLAHDQAVLKEAQTDLARYQLLAKTKAIAVQQVQDQTFVVQQDQGTVQLDEANVATAKLNLEFCHIVSPIEGRAGTLLTNLGNYVQSTTASLVSITQTKPIYVNFTIPQTSFAEVRENQAKGELTVQARSQSGKSLGAGTLTVIDNQVNTTTGTVTLQGTFANENEALWPGEFVTVRLEVFTRENATTVPAEAVMEGPNGPYVYVVNPDNKVRRVDVHVASRQDGIVVIENGITAGDMVVTNGQYRLADNAKVEITGAAKPG